MLYIQGAHVHSSLHGHRHAVLSRHGSYERLLRTAFFSNGRESERDAPIAQARQHDTFHDWQTCRVFTLAPIMHHVQKVRIYLRCHRFGSVPMSVPFN